MILSLELISLITSIRGMRGGVAGGTESITSFINDVLDRMKRNGDKAVRITIEKRENIWK